MKLMRGCGGLDTIRRSVFGEPPECRRILRFEGSQHGDAIFVRRMFCQERGNWACRVST